ncbi:hypothetical protein [Domibacillus mangrovi]|uniref:Uncharacterized protein n=1 Tax=Domibacillus mangrovi TaxID=1714354 RepID=A0A1Q5P405_9BACI|nr:hypothetical protein [Domibacillus mangrovi]OKL36990.1 hypothetical protein BLL40_05205 [Domibacillus mangrovi]
MIELLGHMLMDKEEKEAKASAQQNKTWIHYLMLQYSKPSFGEEKPAAQQNRQKFEEAIRPKQSKATAPVQKQVWDFKLLDQLKVQQKGG